MAASTVADGKATSTKTMFSRTCSVAINIQAPPEQVWILMTDTARMLTWNSTIVSLEGNITLNDKIKLKSTLDPNRTFTLKISELTKPQKMVWEDGFAPMFKGVRTYLFIARPDGTTDFSMTEVFSGLMLPMIEGSLLDFKPSFEQFAADLKQTAENS